MEVEAEAEAINPSSLLHRRGRPMRRNLTAVVMDTMLLLLDRDYRAVLLRGGVALDYRVVHGAQDFKLGWFKILEDRTGYLNVHCMESGATTDLKPGY